MLPKVILYITMSLDGKTNGFELNKNVYNQIKSQINADAIVMDVDTFETSNEITEETEGNSKQLLVVPDNEGRMAREFIGKIASLKNVLILCSRSTPQDYLNFLEENYINHMIIGYDEVNLATAFEELNTQFRVKTIIVHGDGILNAKLVTDELVEEIFVLLHPTMVGANVQDSIYVPDTTESRQQDLRLLEMKEMANELIFLKYRVMKYKF